MLVKLLACDYDGTLASEDRIAPAVLAALERARAAGVALVLVSGRTFFDLTRVCDRLELFDVVVAENGAVLYVPAAGVLRDQAPPPPPRLLAELARRGIPYERGRVVVGTPRAAEAQVRAVLDALGLDMDVVPNRGRLMLLPPGVSKGSGLRQVIRDLRLSFHDVLGIGDAENDLSLLDACGFTACPADAIPALQARVDWVLSGPDGDACAQAITGGILDGAVPVPASPRHRVQIGWSAATARPVTVPARGVDVLVQGDPLSGKSWLAGVLVERLAGARYSVCVVDPEGDYQILARLPGMTATEVRGEASLDRVLAPIEADPTASVVADLSTLPHASKVRAVEGLLTRIQRLRARTGRPHWTILDEAHYSLHPDGVREDALADGAKGICVCTYRASWLRRPLLARMDVLLLARTTAAEELAFLRTAFAGWPGIERIVALLPDLPRGQFARLDAPPAADGPLTFVPVPRETAHVRHLTKYTDAVVAPERRFVFRRPDGRPIREADNLSSFQQAVAEVEDTVLTAHAGRGDFSRWVLGVFSDRELGTQLRKIESRWGRGEIGDLREAIARAVASRYGEDGLR